MKLTTLSRTCFAVIAATLTLSFASTGLAQRVLAASASAKGRYQGTKSVDSGGDTFDLNAINNAPTINNKALINLALGNDTKASVPSNLTLALIVCDETPSLVVYDKNDATIVATIATIDLGDENTVNTAKLVCEGSGEDKICNPVNTSFEGLATLNFQEAGDSDHGINGGSVQVYLKGSFDSDGECPVKVSGTGAGSIDVTVTLKDDNGDEVPAELHLLLQNFKLSTSKNITPTP